MNVDDIISFIKEKGVSDKDWRRMYDAAIEHDRNKSEDDEHKCILADIRELERLYNEDDAFRAWCEDVLKVEKWQEYLNEQEKQSPFAIKYDCKCEPGEDYYIPSLLNKKFDDNGTNNFIYLYYTRCLFYVPIQVFDLIVDGTDETSSHGSKAFAAFWHSKFHTTLTPEFVVDSEYPDSKQVELYGNTYEDYVIARYLFNFTIWDFDSLKELYQEALSSE